MTLRAMLRTRMYGLGMVAIFGLVLALVWALFTQALTPTVDVLLRTDRAGLLMAAKNDVRVRGVVIGRVHEVRLAGDRAELLLKLDRDQAHLVPANATATINPSTVFGNKFVNLSAPERGATGQVRDGSVLRADDVGVEVNTVFANLMNVLDTLEPATVNATLHAVATTLDGRGERLGRFLESTNDYLARLNPLLHQLRRDLDGTAAVSHLYAELAPDFFHVLDNATHIGATVVDKQRALAALLTEVEEMGGQGARLFTENGQELLETLRLLQPTSALLAKYSPMLTCFLTGEDYARTMLEPVFGGTDPMARFNVGFLPGKEPYTNPDNLPRVGANSGPDCHGLPDLAGAPFPAAKSRMPGTGADTPGVTGEHRVRVGQDPVRLLLGEPTAGGGGR